VRNDVDGLHVIELVVGFKDIDIDIDNRKQFTKYILVSHVAISFPYIYTLKKGEATTIQVTFLTLMISALSMSFDFRRVHCFGLFLLRRMGRKLQLSPRRYNGLMNTGLLITTKMDSAGSCTIKSSC